MEGMQENTLVIGDSIIRDLNAYHIRTFNNGCFWVHGSPVTVAGKSGAMVEDVGYELVNVENGCFSVVVLAVGGNDLCRGGRSCQNVSDDIMSLSRFLIDRKGVSRVVICEILNRLQVNRHFEVPLTEFNNRVLETNRLLADFCSLSHYPIVFWRHMHKLRHVECVTRDGTHLE
jgi:hypothetical protein